MMIETILETTFIGVFAWLVSEWIGNALSTAVHASDFLKKREKLAKAAHVAAAVIGCICALAWYFVGKAHAHHPTIEIPLVVCLIAFAAGVKVLIGAHLRLQLQGLSASIGRAFHFHHH
jgi:hypothetical protein